MLKIIGNDLKKLIPMLREDPLDYPLALGILEGKFTGYAFVNNPKTPDKAIIFHSHAGFMHYLGSEPNSAEAEDIGKTALSYRSDRTYCNWVEFAHCPDSVTNLIREKYPKAESYLRISLNHDYEIFAKGPKPIVPTGCSLRFLDKALFNIEFLRSETEMFWDSTNIFLEKAFGTVMLDSNDKFEGVCGAVSASGGFYEINIEVKESKRRMGIGYAVAHRFIQECYNREEHPHWDCNEHNIPSQKIAAKLGFVEVGRYPLVSWTY